MSNVLHVMQVDSSAEDWQEFIRQVTACLKFIERFSNPDLKVNIICDHQDNTPEGTVGVSTAAQVGVASEVPPRLTFTLQTSPGFGGSLERKLSAPRRRTKPSWLRQIPTSLSLVIFS